MTSLFLLRGKRLVFPTIFDGNTSKDGTLHARQRKRVPLLAWLLVIYAVPTILFFAVAMPPTQVADEFSHLARADHISRGEMVSRTGSRIDGAAYWYGKVFSGIPFHVELKVTGEMAQKAAALAWAAPDEGMNFPNTAQYSPLLYAPQATGIWLGRSLGLNPVWTFLGARLINGFVALAIGFAAMCLCRRGVALTFTTLLLPMTLSQFASVSQDALIISLSIFVIAQASRLIDENRPAGLWEFAAFAAIVAATTMARPSQIALAPLGLVFMGQRDVLLWPKIAIVFVAACCIAAWIAILSTLLMRPPDGASIHGQMMAMLDDPLLLPRAMLGSLQIKGDEVYQTLVGRFGWMDTAMPDWYYRAAVVALICAVLAPSNRRPFVFPALLGTITFLVFTTTVSAAIYISWAPVRHPYVETMQGRYILPVLPLVAWAIPPHALFFARLWSWTWIVVILFPVVSLVALPGALMTRYYGSWENMGLVLRTLFLS